MFCKHFFKFIKLSNKFNKNFRVKILGFSYENLLMCL